MTIRSIYADQQANEYRCPQGHALLRDRRQFTKPRDRITQAGTIIYSASQHDCTGCLMKQLRCPPVTVEATRRAEQLESAASEGLPDGWKRPDDEG